MASAVPQPASPPDRPYDLAAYNRVVCAHPGELDLEIPVSMIHGQVPAELWGGTVFGNGPGWLNIGGRLVHPFDGHGYVRALRLSQGQLRLQARFVDTPAFRAESAANAVRFRGLGTQVPGGALANIRAPGFRNTANTCVLPWGGKLYALWEGGAPYVLHPTTLATQGIDTFGGALTERTPFLAHTRLDAEKQRLVALTPVMGTKQTRLTFYEIDRAGTIVSRTSAEIDGMSFYHDFLITSDYYVLLENRVQPKLGAYLRYRLGLDTIFPVLCAVPGHPGRALLVPRRPGDQRCQAIRLGQPTYAYHHANAWQEGDRVVVVSCVYDYLQFGSEFGYRGPALPLDPGPARPNPGQQLLRIELHPASGGMTRRALGAHSADFPRIHPLRDGRPTRYVFAATNSRPGQGDPFDSLLCADTETGETAVYTPQPAQFVGEPLVVPRAEPPGAAPASGAESVWVLALFYDGQAERSTLAIFAGEDLARGPVATLDLPVLLPYGLHGSWYGGPPHSQPAPATQ